MHESVDEVFVLGDREWLREEVGIDVGALVVDNLEYALSHSVSYPVVSHVNCFGSPDFD